MDLSDYREKIDSVDKQIVKLFSERMDIAAQIAQYKKENGKPIADPVREREKLFEIAGEMSADMRAYAVSLYSLIFELSRSYQMRLTGEAAPLAKKIEEAIETTEKLFPESAAVACQGVEGAYSQLACDKLFKMPSVLYFSNFEAVFAAIEKGLCRYGVIPLENSTAGSVNMVYDLMMKHNFNIVRSIRLKVDHNLLAKPGTKLSDVKEIYSHEQAISQCTKFLEGMPDVKIISCENTAVAAKMVADSDRKDVAALSSRSCMKLYGLECIEADVQDSGNNYTRFICISKNLEIYPGADRTSLMMVLPHEPGSLYKVLSRFYALGINLNKLESRPMPERIGRLSSLFKLMPSAY